LSHIPSFRARNRQEINPSTKSCSSQASLARSFYLVLQYISLLPGSFCIFIVILHGTFFLDRQIHFYTIPSLDPFPIKPIRHVVTFAVDDQHLRRPAPTSAGVGIQLPVEPVDFCVVKRNGIAMYTLTDRLFLSPVTLLYRTTTPLLRTSSRKSPSHKQLA
jgi:hypothetical protein